MKSSNQIKVEVRFTASQSDEMSLKDKNVVVIDVLRACTTVAAALANGAKEIIPVNSIESVVKISGNLFGDVTLRAGERGGKRIEGFNLGNSPREYEESIVKGKSIIFITTNGTPAIVKGRHSKNLVLGSFVNLSRVVEFLGSLDGDAVIVCSGHDGRFCIEDAVCAGRMVGRIQETFPGKVVTDDAGAAAVALDKNVGKGLLKMLRNSEHGQYLSDLGFADDLKICSGVDTIPVLPILAGSVLRSFTEHSKQR